MEKKSSVQKEKYRFPYLFTILFTLWFGLITFLSLLSLASFPKTNIEIDYFDKFVHFVFYFLLVAFALLAWKERFSTWPPFRTALVIVFIGALYGIGVEVMQEYMGLGRHGDVFDALANSLGAIVGGLLTKRYGSLIGWLK